MLAYAGIHFTLPVNGVAAMVAILITCYFWWLNIKGIPESSHKALRLSLIHISVGMFLHERETVEVTAKFVFVVVWRVLGRFGFGGVGRLPIESLLGAASCFVGFARFARVGRGERGFWPCSGRRRGR